MATSVPTTTIDNTSNQVVRINYGVIDDALSVTTVPPTKTGMLNIPPQTKVTIETSRIDPGQLENLATLGTGLIAVTEGLVST